MVKYAVPFVQKELVSRNNRQHNRRILTCRDSSYSPSPARRRAEGRLTLQRDPDSIIQRDLQSGSIPIDSC